MNSLEIRETKIELIEMVNKIALPLEVKRMILTEILSELEAATSSEIDVLLADRQKKQKAEDGQDE